MHAIAQNNFNVKGIVTDSLGESIIGASVILSSKADSVMVGFSLTDGAGNFSMNKIPKGEYILQVTYMGYKNHLEYAKIPRDGQNDYDFGNIILHRGNTLLEEVVIMEDRIPIMIKKDTIEYHAGSFEVHQNAVVEELLQELPGIEVAEDGSIKANGKDVQNVLVDGREFFGKDPKMATKNLPAKAVDKVQVYDKKSEEATFAGMIASDEDETTINLKLKEEYKKGYIGKVEAGGGTDRTFSSNLNLNKFDKNNQVSIIGRVNNITNQSGLSIEETIKFAGGLQSLMSDSDNGMISLETNNSQYDGINTIGLLGLNYNWIANPKISILSNYKIDVIKADLEETSFRENKLENLSYSTIDSLNQRNKKMMNIANLNLKFKPDSTFRISWNNTLNFNLGNSNNSNQNQNENEWNRLANSQTSISDSEGRNWKWNSRLLFQKKLKSGIVLSSNSKAILQNNIQSYANNSLNHYYDDNEEITSSISINRKGNERNPKSEISQKFSYVQPIGKFVRWDNSYKIMNQMEKDNNQFDEFLDDEWINNVELSRNFNLNQLDQKINSRLQYIRRKYSIGIGGTYQNSVLKLKEGNGILLNREYNYFLPSLIARLEIKRSSFLNLYYSTNVNMPSIYQLNPVVNDNNPTRISQGNMNLVPEYQHNVSFGYSLFDQFSFNSLNIRLSMNQRQHTIIQESIIDDNLIERTAPVNSIASTMYNINLNYGTPIKFIRSRLNLDMNTSINRLPNSINGITHEYRQFVQSLGMNISNKKKKNWDIKVGYHLNFNRSKNLDENERLSSFSDHSFHLKSNYRFNNGLRFGNKLRYRTFSNSADAFLLWDAFIEKTIFKNEKGLLSLSVTDILNKNRGIERTSNNFYSLQRMTNTRGRYVMLTFSYNLAFFGKGEK